MEIFCGVKLADFNVTIVTTISAMFFLQKMNRYYYQSKSRMVHLACINSGTTALHANNSL